MEGQKLREALRGSSHLSRHNIVVEVMGDKVILRGRVSSYYLKQIAQEVARRALNGSAEMLVVDNQIEVV